MVNLGGGRDDGYINCVSCLGLVVDGDVFCIGSYDVIFKVF